MQDFLSRLLGRSAQISDVLIDSVGAVAAIVVYLGVARIKIKKYPLSQTLT
ncbi:MAG: VanZ family protein [Clostridiales bacterium]|nr:VanZ family protein [Clostridiales bacterium]